MNGRPAQMAKTEVEPDSISELADSLMADLEQNNDDSNQSYSDNLRSSSYAVLHQSALPVVPQPGTTTSSARKNSVYTSLPFVSSSLLIEPPIKNNKTPRTCELEEYAKKYEAKQRNVTARRRLHQSQDHSTQPRNFWQQTKRPSLQENRSNVWQNGSEIGGRDSVTTVLSNSSNETVKCQTSYSNGNREQIYQNCSQINYGSPVYSEYASLPPEPRMQKDLKKFPLQTYPSQSLSQISDQSSTNSSSNTSTSARPKMKSQVSEKILRSKSSNSSQDPISHSKSVPNLVNQNDNGNPADESTTSCSPEDTNHQASFSYLDPDKRLRVTDNTLKLIQKQALLDYYERHNSSMGKSKKEAMDSGFYSPTENKILSDCGNVIVHQEEDANGEQNVEVGTMINYCLSSHFNIT